MKKLLIRFYIFLEVLFAVGSWAGTSDDTFASLPSTYSKCKNGLVNNEFTFMNNQCIPNPTTSIMGISFDKSKQNEYGM